MNYVEEEEDVEEGWEGVKKSRDGTSSGRRNRERSNEKKIRRGGEGQMVSWNRRRKSKKER